MTSGADPSSPWTSRSRETPATSGPDRRRQPSGADTNLYDVVRSAALWASAFEILYPAKRAAFKGVYAAIEGITWTLSDCKDKKYQVFGDKNGPPRSLPVWLFGEINSLRNDALHGNPIPTGRLIVAPAKQPLHQFAAPLYRMILTAYLDLKLTPRKPVAGLTKYESFGLDHLESGEYQRDIEAGLSTIMYAAEECLVIKYGIFTWGRQDLLRAILSCQLDGLVAARGKTDQATDLRQKLVDHLVQNQPRFMDLNGAKPIAKAHSVGSVPGYVQTHRGKSWIYLTSDQLKAIIGADKAARRLKRRLVEEGLMAATGNRALVQRAIFKAKGNKGYRWVHAFRASLLESSIDTPRRLALNKNR